MFNASKLSAPKLFEHGLLFGVLFVFMSATISGEPLELLTGMFGALIVYAMKERSSRRRASAAKCQEGWLVGGSVRKIFPRLRKAEATTQVSCADGLPRCDPALAHLRAYVQAELGALRAECKLDHWKQKAEKAEAELAQLQVKIAALEHDLIRADSGQSTEGIAETQIEDLLMDLTDAKLKAEEVEAELTQSQTKIAELENDVAQAASVQRRTEESEQTRFEVLATDLTTSADQSETDVDRAIWAEQDMEMQLSSALY